MTEVTSRYGFLQVDEYEYGDIVNVKKCASGSENLKGRVVYKDSRKVGVLIYKPDLPMTPLNAIYTEYFSGIDINENLSLIQRGE